MRLCPEVSIHGLATSSWADAGRNTFGWLGNPTQYELFRDVERMEKGARRAGGELLTKMAPPDHVGPRVFSPRTDRRGPCRPLLLQPLRQLHCPADPRPDQEIDDLEVALSRFEVLKKKEKTAILIISPETGRLPEDMGGLARFISGKSGGQGEVVSALCEGLTERGYDVHLAILNLKKRFQRESQMNELQWRRSATRSTRRRSISSAPRSSPTT